MGGLTKSALNRLERALDLDSQYDGDNERESAEPAENPTFVDIDVEDSDADWLAQFSEEPVPSSSVASPAFVDSSSDVFNTQTNTDSFSAEQTTSAVSVERPESKETRRWLHPVVVIALLGAVAGSLIGLFSSPRILGGWIHNQSPTAEESRGTPDSIRPLPETQRQTSTQVQAQTKPPITLPPSHVPTAAVPPPPATLQDRTGKTDAVALRPPPPRTTPSTPPAADPAAPPDARAPTTSPPAVASQTPAVTAPDVPSTSLTTVLPTGTIPRSPSLETAPPSRPSEPPKGVNENSAIYMVLGRYQSAFNDLNANVAKSVWPSVDEKTLARAFDSLEHQEVVFDACQIEVAGAHAIASCRGRAQYVPKVGSKAARLQPRRWIFRLSNNGTNWIIDSVESR